jgi:transposase
MQDEKNERASDSIEGERSASERRSGYTRVPEIPEELQRRFIEMVNILAGDQTVTGAARALGLSRVQMQTVQHRFIEGAIMGMSARPSGRRPKSERERDLEEKVKHLERALRASEEHAAMLERFVEVAGDLIRSGPSTKRGKRSSSSRSASETTSTTTTKDPEDPDPVKRRERRVSVAADMRARGMRAVLVAKLLHVGASTMRRWRRRMRRGEPLVLAVARARSELDSTIVDAIIERVRETNGAIGADALRHAVPGVSRREAARIKGRANTDREQRRVERAEPIVITQPGVVRGFDQLHLATYDGVRWLLISADAAIPYRTSAPLVASYDGASVLAALEADFDEHGAPLVIRMDRASSHRVPAVRAMLADRKVLVLHGPPRHPRFYGQLERQNRAHRALLAGLGERPRVAEIEAYVPEMRRVLNERWPLRALGWETPAAVWTRRPDLGDHRNTLYAEVQQRAARIAARIGDDVDRAQRIAIESALYERGFLKLTTGAALNGIPC